MHADSTLQKGLCVSQRLWLLARQAGAPQPLPETWRVIPGAFDPEQLKGLGLPIDGSPTSRQTVALISGHESDRKAVGTEAAIAYSNRPRTQLYESVGAQSGGWFAVVDLFLSRLFGFEVTSDVYVSNAGDAGLHRHRDDWYGLIVQLDGSKSWTIWRSEGDSATFTLDTGDVLLLPNHVWHRVSTPHHSTHVVFAVMTHEPIAELITA